MSQLHRELWMYSMSWYLIYYYSLDQSNHERPYPQSLPEILVPPRCPDVGRLRDKCLHYWTRESAGSRRAYELVLDHQWQSRNRARWGGEGRREVFREEL